MHPPFASAFAHHHPSHSPTSVPPALIPAGNSWPPPPSPPSLPLHTAHLCPQILCLLLPCCHASQLRAADGVLVPGGFGNRGVEGKILAAQYARENKVPYLGICLGMQVRQPRTHTRAGMRHMHPACSNMQDGAWQQAVCHRCDELERGMSSGPQTLCSAPQLQHSQKWRVCC